MYSVHTGHVTTMLQSCHITCMYSVRTGHVISDTTMLQSWNEHVSVQKAILPGLWSVMDSGGHGSAKVIYPCFLPLLSQLVDKVNGQW